VTLRLRKESLTELSPTDLDFVVGGMPPQPTPPIYAPTHVSPCATLLC
jgi:hypothetical protein